MNLTAYIAQRGDPFAWRTRNCCHFAAGWVKERTGRDPMAGLPPTPSALAAKRLVGRLGGSLVNAWTRQMGQEPNPALMAQTGDIVIVGNVAGICVGAQVAMLLEDGSIGFAPLCDGLASWRVA